MASRKQIEYINDLLIDVGYADRTKRNAYLSAEMEREIKYVDDLTVEEASRIIQQLKDMKENEWEAKARERNKE
jgi:hypothetical protein